MKVSERLVVVLGLSAIMKPCCLLFWAAVSLGMSGWFGGGAALWLINGMRYEKYLLLFPLIGLGIGQFEIWTALYRRLKNPRKTPWRNWVVKSIAIQTSTLFTIYVIMYPEILPWNMSH